MLQFGDAADDLRQAVLRTVLTDRERAETMVHLGAIDENLRRPEPDRRRIGDRLSALVTVLAAAGAFATGSASLLSAITAFAGLLGRFGSGAIDIIRDAANR